MRNTYRKHLYYFRYKLYSDSYGPTWGKKNKLTDNKKKKIAIISTEGAVELAIPHRKESQGLLYLKLFKTSNCILIESDRLSFVEGPNDSQASIHTSVSSTKPIPTALLVWRLLLDFWLRRPATEDMFNKGKEKQCAWPLCARNCRVARLQPTYNGISYTSFF